MSTKQLKIRTKIIPKADVVIVKCDQVEEVTKTEGGIHLPDDAQPIIVKRTGRVYKVGPDCVRCKEGDRVLFSAYAGTPIEVGGEEYDLMFDHNILCEID